MNITMTTEPRGWSCPHCGKAHAPNMKTCPEPVMADCWPPVTTDTPLFPPHVKPPWEPTTGGTFTVTGYAEGQLWNGEGFGG